MYNSEIWYGTSSPQYLSYSKKSWKNIHLSSTYMVTKFPQLIVNKTCNIAYITVNFGMVLPLLSIYHIQKSLKKYSFVVHIYGHEISTLYRQFWPKMAKNGQKPWKPHIVQNEFRRERKTQFKIWFDFRVYHKIVHNISSGFLNPVEASMSNDYVTEYMQKL